MGLVKEVPFKLAVNCTRAIYLDVNKGNYITNESLFIITPRSKLWHLQISPKVHNCVSQ